MGYCLLGILWSETSAPYVSYTSKIIVKTKTQMKLTQTTWNVHAQRQPQCQKAQRHLYSTDWCWGLASGVTQILALCNTKIYQHVGVHLVTQKCGVGGLSQRQDPTPIQWFCVAVEYRLKGALKTCQNP